MSHSHAQAPQGPQPLPGVDAIIAVGSGKGGVGNWTLVGAVWPRRPIPRAARDPTGASQNGLRDTLSA